MSVEMQNYICVTCGVQSAATAQPPDHCRICEDDRQYINSVSYQSSRGDVGETLMKV